MSKGFTLIEIILVVAVMLVLAGMAPTFYTRFLLQNATANTTDEIVGSLRKAQISAMTSKQGSAWSVNFSANAVTLYIGTTFAGHNIAFDEKFSKNSNITISCPLCVNGTDISFARVTGLPTPSTATITVSSSNGDSETISVNSQGVVSK
jgi:prepilin-type N-terminal cleavage/methylation domain-containing protein